MSEPTLKTGDARDERIRLLDYQLGYLRAELTQLTRERDLMIYSASWHVFKPLRRLEAGLVDAFRGALAARHPARAASRVAEARRRKRRPRPSSGAPARLLIDVTGVIKRDAGTGIQRVVKKVVEALYRDDGL